MVKPLPIVLRKTPPIKPTKASQVMHSTQGPRVRPFHDMKVGSSVFVQEFLFVAKLAIILRRI
jgi:hypothetical protein